MITATGRTFEHRELLKSMRGQFDQVERRWTFDRLTADQLARLRGLVGVIVMELPDAVPEPSQSVSDILAGLFGSAGPRKAGRSPSVLYGDDGTYHNHFADQNPRAFFGFSTLGKMLEYIDRIAPTHADDPRRTGWDTDGATSWQGSRSMADAVKLAREGWQDGTQRALDAMERLSIDNPRVRKRRASVAGGTVNVGRMLSGDPAHMVRRPKSPGRKVVTFFVEAGCNAIISADSMVMRAAIIGAMVDLMENAGYSCTIVAIDTSVSDGPMYQLAVVLKQAGERLNLSDLMFALGHPSFLRRFSFAICSSVDETRSIWRDQGSASNSFDDDHRTGPSEFYVPVQRINHEGDDPLYLIDHVVPDGLPVEIKRNV